MLAVAIGQVDGVFVDALVAWYRTSGRSLRIRELRDPYAIWIGETMSQQTQIARVGEALPAFLERFPDIEALAAASNAAVVRAWGGLGYPRRALALRDAARTVVDRFGGVLPRVVDELVTLPGVGPYTARAVAATAYRVPVTAVDVNARRVLGRVLTGRALPASLSPVVQTALDGLAPVDAAADWNHGLMDLGALVCRPLPDCPACPVRTWCRAGTRLDPRAIATDGAVSGGSPGRGQRRATPFVATHRYVRGRMLGALRDLPSGAWLTLDAELLGIARERVERAVRELADEGFLELDGASRVRLRET